MASFSASRPAPSLARSALWGVCAGGYAWLTTLLVLLVLYTTLNLGNEELQGLEGALGFAMLLTVFCGLYSLLPCLGAGLLAGLLLPPIIHRRGPLLCALATGVATALLGVVASDILASFEPVADPFAPAVVIPAAMSVVMAVLAGLRARTLQAGGEAVLRTP